MGARMLDLETEELVVLLDSAGRSIGTLEKSRVHTAETPLHSAFSVFLFNRRGYMLAQRRAWSKLTWPGIWSNACCGHPGVDESHADAACRRMSYELGLSKVKLEMALPKFRYRAEKSGIVENEICPVLVGVIDEPVQLQPHPEEVAEVKWVHWQDFLRANPDDPHCEFGAFSPWSVMEARALNDSSRFAEITEAMGVDLK